MKKGILWINLSKESRKKLLSLVKPSFEVVHAEHITLQYPAYQDECLNLIGQKEKILVTSHKSNGEIETVTVSIDKDLPCGNKIPHITVSAKKGVAPVKSNEMLASGVFEINEPLNLELEGTVEFFEF